MPYQGYNGTAGYNPIKEEGYKIIGYEIYEEISTPDILIAPCGNGSLLFSVYKSFNELKILGLVNKLPKMIGVQIKSASPLKESFEKKEDFVVLDNIPDSIAEGILASESFSSSKLMVALKETQGEIVEVNDSEIIESIEEVVKLESLLPEPTSGSVFAAIKKLTKFKGQKIVLIMTAGGLRELEKTLALL